METIDQFHKKQMDYFQEIKNIIIPSFQKERIVLKNKLIVENNYEEKLLIIDKIKEIREKIKNIKFLEKNYLLKNMNHLEIYYNNKKEVENNNNEKTVLNEFFNISPVEETVENTNDKFWNCNNKPHLKYYNQNMCQSCDMEMKEKIKSIKFLEKNYLLKNMNHLEIYYNNKYIYMCLYNNNTYTHTHTHTHIYIHITIISHERRHTSPSVPSSTSSKVTGFKILTVRLSNGTPTHPNRLDAQVLLPVDTTGAEVDRK